jgi:all-trans-retinol dehydrogenase (NAD+)
LAQNNFRWKSEKHRYDWPKEIAVVTGAGSGFGRLISEGFSSNGIRVMALDIHDSLPAEMQLNKKIHYYKCDITSVEAVNATAEAIRSEHGNPSILINNAGVAFEGNILKATPDQVRHFRRQHNLPLFHCPGILAFDDCAAQGSHRHPCVHGFVHICTG